MLKTLSPLTKDDMFEFLELFQKETISSVELKLYNGTGSGYTELPNGGHISHPHMKLFVRGVDYIQPGLDSVEHNQIQECRVQLYGSTESAQLDLISKKMRMTGNFPSGELETIVAFCRAKEIRECVLCF